MTPNSTTSELAGESANPLFYNKDSATYDEQRWESKTGQFVNAAQQKILQDLCAEWNDRRILEAGPGTARFSIPLAKKKNHLTLLDISTGMLDVARANLEKAGCVEQVDEFVEGSIYELPFDDASFDHALSLNVFNHLERPGDALKQLAGVIKPGSTLLFNYANLQSYYWPAARKINQNKTAVGKDVYSTWERPGEMDLLIDEAGLDLIQRVGNVHVPSAMEKYPVRPIVMMLDAISRSGPLKRFAPFHFCLCRKRR